MSLARTVTRVGIGMIPIALVLACSSSSETDPKLEALKKKREAEEKARIEATKPKPPGPPVDAPSPDQLKDRCKQQQDAAACQGSCGAGDMESCYQMGLLWEEGGGGLPKTDFDAARRFHIRACEGGYGQGCYSAGVFYDYGKSVPKNPRKAREYFDQACKLGISAGCKELEDKK